MSIQEGSFLFKELQRGNPKLGAYGTYQYTKLTPITAPGATTAGGDVSEIELPAKVANHALDRLEFTCTMPDVAQVGTGYDAYNKMFTDGIAPIRELQLVSRGGQYIVNVPFFNKYTNSILRSTVPFDTLQTLEQCQGAVADTYYFEGLSMCNLSTATVRVPVTPGAMVAPNKSIIEAGALTQNSTVNTALAVNFRINMGMLKDTFFNVSKDINFNEIVLLRIIWDETVKVGFRGSAQDNTATNLATSTNIVITNLYYYMALQKNQSIINMVKDEARQEMLIPFVLPTKVQGTANASNDLTLRYNTSSGARLVRLYWTPYNNTETGTTVYDRDNGAGGKVTSFSVWVDGERTQPFDYTCASLDDYSAIKHLLKGSSLLSGNEYKKYMTFIQNFGDNEPLCEDFDYSKQNVKEGMPIEKEIKINIQYTAGATQVQNYIFAVVQKKLIVDRDAGIIVNNESF